MEINCYGTIALHAQRGNDVFVCNIANGCMGDMLNTTTVTADIRFNEAQNAAKIIGVKEYINLGIDDLYVNPYDKEQLKKVIDVIRKARLDYILWHGNDGYMDYQRDYNEAASPAFNASFVFETVVPLYYFEPLSSNAFWPTDYVDITDVIDIKMETLACHES